MKTIPTIGADALATKTDLDALEERVGLRFSRDLAAVSGALRTEMADLRGELRTEMADLRGELRTEIGGVRAEMADLRASLEATIRGQTWRLSGLVVAALGVGITLARLA